MYHSALGSRVIKKGKRRKKVWVEGVGAVPILVNLVNQLLELLVGQVHLRYRGTSPIRKRPSPQDPPRTLGIGLR